VTPPLIAKKVGSYYILRGGGGSYLFGFNIYVEVGPRKNFVLYIETLYIWAAAGRKFMAYIFALYIWKIIFTENTQIPMYLAPQDENLEVLRQSAGIFLSSLYIWPAAGGKMLADIFGFHDFSAKSCTIYAIYNTAPPH